MLCWQVERPMMDKCNPKNGGSATRAPGLANRLLTPPEVARLWRIRHDKVLAWIRSGELRAVNVTAKPGGRPTYRIDPDDLKAFADRRAAVPLPRRSKQRKREQTQPGKEYF